MTRFNLIDSVRVVVSFSSKYSIFAIDVPLFNPFHAGLLGAIEDRERNWGGGGEAPQEPF